MAPRDRDSVKASRWQTGWPSCLPPDRHTSNACRNKQPLLEALQETLRQHNLSNPHVLEVASGTGQHAAHFAAALSNASFQPTEHAAEMLPSIQAWTQGLSNVQPPKLLNAAGDWAEVSEDRFDVVMVANMCHISPWACTEGSGQALRPGGLLLVYGPFKRDGQCTSESNASFDQSLQMQNPEWGYRDVAEVDGAAQAHGLTLQSVKDMPANNFFLTFRRGC